jgi:hypothetical protein
MVTTRDLKEKKEKPRELLLNRYRISVLQDQKSYGANGGEG